MDNTIIPYVDTSDSSGSELSDESSGEEHSQMLSNNVGIHYNKFINEKSFMNMEDSKAYKEKRDRIFTPEISKRLFTVKISSAANPTFFTLEDDIKLPRKNIIGFHSGWNCGRERET